MQGTEAHDTWAAPPEPQAPSPLPPQAPVAPAVPPVAPVAAPPSAPLSRPAPIHDTGVQNLVAALGLSGQLKP